MKRLFSLMFLTLVLGAFAIGCAEKASSKPAAPPAAPSGGAEGGPTGAAPADKPTGP
jgi:hypothetical protein